MAKIINITNGTGTSNVTNGNYNVTASVVGYDNTTLDPSNIVVDTATNEYAFTIEAEGTLTLHVSEDGTPSGTPVVGATFIITDAQGNAVFEDVPYASENAPTVYFKQTASDGSHDFSNQVQSTTLTTDTETVEITNALSALRTFTLTDANYEGLPIGTGTLTLE